MLLYGTNGLQFSTQLLPRTTCPACGTTGELRVRLASHYVHVYGVPLLPYQKLAVVQCHTCHASWADKAWDAALAPAVRDVKEQTTHPYWTWTGLAVVMLFALGSLFSTIRAAHTDEVFLASPRAGDIYTVRSDSAAMYSLLKVRQVSGNSVELLANNYQVDNDTPINSLNEPARYSQEPFVITRLDLQIMRRKGQLIDVDRLESLNQ